MDKKDAIKATKYGAIAACVSAFFTSLIVSIAIFTDSRDILFYWNDPLNFIDVVVVLACAYGMYRKSRVASITIFLFFLVNQIVMSIELQTFGRNIGVALVFLYFYGRAIQGSFIYHKLEKEENQNYKVSKLSYIFGIPSVAIIVILMGFLIHSTLVDTSPDLVLTESEMNQTDLELLRNSGIIAHEDSVVYFYSHDRRSIFESGNILTQDRVILYLPHETDSELITIHEVFLDEITDIELEEKGGAFYNSIFKIITNDPERWLMLILTTNQDGDKIFVEEILNRASG